ncbi:MAG: type 4a pilus biogenesis protein PilO, partial [Minisyncoccia bacterium]
LSILLIIILIAGSLFIYLNSIRPSLAKIKENQKNILETKEKIRLINEYKAKAEQLMNYYASLVSQIENINLALPDEPLTDQILAILNELSKKNNINFLQMSFQESVGEDEIGRVEVRTTFSSNYQGLKSFLNEIEKELRLADLKDLRVKAPPETQLETSSKGTKVKKVSIADVPLSGEMTLVFYYLPK